MKGDIWLWAKGWISTTSRSTVGVPSESDLLTSQLEALPVCSPGLRAGVLKLSSRKWGNPAADMINPIWKQWIMGMLPPCWNLERPLSLYLPFSVAFSSFLSVFILSLRLCGFKSLFFCFEVSLQSFSIIFYLTDTFIYFKVEISFEFSHNFGYTT